MPQDQLSVVLADFARTMLTDFPIQAILDNLVERVVDVLPVTGAGVTLIAPGLAPREVAASDAASLQYEQLQTDLNEGPCLLAYASGEAVAVPDLAADEQFPRFGPAALAAGMRAVFTFPLRHGPGRLGALDLYRDTPGMLTEAEMRSAQVLADVVSAYLINARTRQQALDVSEQFRVSALHDALTGLPNRLLLAQRLEHVAQRAERSHMTVGVLFVDLDKFKRVNDTHGHGVGDELLVAVAARLKGVVRPSDTLARVSGDEFVVLCEDLADVTDAERLALRIRSELSAPFVVADRTVAVTASVGIAYAGPGQAVTTQLLDDADTAMYQAKRRGGAVHEVIDVREADEASRRDHLEAELRAALDRRELSLAYQPVVDTPSRLVTGAEALLRWTHPDEGRVPAQTTVSIAERHELLTGIGAWVLERACRDRMHWADLHPDRPVELSVNVSALQVMSPGYVDGVRSTLEATGMPAAALVLELTEGRYLDDPERARTVLDDLKDLGVRLALDDFGTGYCSLSYLRQFPIDVVKIDKSFVAELPDDPVTARITASVTALAHDLGMTVTAEGVETDEQYETVRGIGLDHCQGHLFARPMTGEQFGRLLGAPLQLPTQSAPGQRVERR